MWFSQKCNGAGSESFKKKHRDRKDLGGAVRLFTFSAQYYSNTVEQSGKNPSFGCTR